MWKSHEIQNFTFPIVHKVLLEFVDAHVFADALSVAAFPSAE